MVTGRHVLLRGVVDRRRPRLGDHPHVHVPGPVLGTGGVDQVAQGVGRPLLRVGQRDRRRCGAGVLLDGTLHYRVQYRADDLPGLDVVTAELDRLVVDEALR